MTEQLIFTLNNGVQMPALGYGVFQTPPAETAEAVVAALAAGYRAVDTAAVYANETGVGQGLGKSGLPREEIFVETKVWINDYGYEETLHAYEKAVKKLGLDQIDLLILHQPMTTGFERSLEAYRALEKLYADGKVRAIGVSNFMVEDLQKLLAVAKVVPAVNQVEFHPYYQPRELEAFHREHGILTQCWSPIGGISFYPGFANELPSTLENPAIGQIAQHHGKTPAQVMLRWHLQQGRQVIPKSVTPSRIAENFDIFDFELSAAELAVIDGLDTGVRGGPDPATMTFEGYSVEIPEA